MNLESMMRRAMRLGERGRGASGSNPLVGAIISRNGRIVGQGWYSRFGGPHAEAKALAQAGSSARGAVLAVTMEPCGNSGKTPPCTRMIIAAGIYRVAIGCSDPSQRGRGLACLRKAGIQVTHGILAREIERQNADFFAASARRMPAISLKLAMTLDGRIADRRGRSKWITSPAARRWTRTLRKGADALMVGIGTVLADDPRLATPGRPAGAFPIIVDSRARTPVGARVIKPGRAIIAALRGTPPERIAALERRGAEVVLVRGAKGAVDLAALMRLLYRRGVGRILCEGGGKLAGSLLEAGLVRRLYAITAPRIMADLRAVSAIQGRGRLLQSAIKFHILRQERLGPDLVVEACPVSLGK